MKKLILALALSLLGLGPVQAGEMLPLQGEYQFEGQFNILQSYQIYVVRLYRDSDRAKLAELKATGFTCDYVDSKTARCKRFEDVTTLPSNVTQRLQKRYQDVSVLVSAASQAPDVLNKGEHYTEYLVHQPIHVGALYWQNFRYFESDELHKIQTGLEIPASFSFVVESTDRLQLINLEASTTENGYYSFLVGIPFSK